jgi:hypothetical protein
MAYVNRRLGSICEGESWWSIGQKFSYLNCVPFTEFMFLIQQDENARSARRSYHPRLVEGVDETRAAALLDEPVSTFRYSGDNLYIPDFLRRFHPVPSFLRYCPKCMEFGFHSPVHQLPWFNRCLLHGCALVTGCPSCRKELSYSSNENLKNRVDRYRCSCGEPLWGDLLLSRWQKQMDRETLQPIYSYLDWIRNLRIPGRDSFPMALEFLTGGGQHDYMVDVTWIMCCLSSISDAPAEVRAALPETIMPSSLRIKSTDVKPEAILAAINQIGYLKLLSSYRFWSEQTNLTPMMLPLAKSIRKYLLGRHTRCLNGQISLMIAGAHHFYRDTKCYCTRVRNALIFEKRWILLHDDNNDFYYRELAFEVADSLRNCGMVRYSNDFDKQYDMRWSSCGRNEFVGDYDLNIHVCPALTRLMDRIWALEMFKSAYVLSAGTKQGGQMYSRPFDGPISNPLVLAEVGPDDTLGIWIWPRLPLRDSARPEGGRALRRHQAQVASLTAEDEARVLAEGHPFDRLFRR